MNARYTPSIVLTLLLGFAIQGKAADRPNVVMIVLDDLNDYVGVLGGHPQAKTPNIDRLAREGVLFENAQANVAVCSPSRASFMTGIHPAVSGCWGFDNWFDNEGLMNSKTLGELAMENGYSAYAAGKVLHTHKPYMWEEKGVKKDYGPLAFNGKKTVPHPDSPPGMQELGALDSTFTRLSNVPSVPATDDAPGHTGWSNAKWGQESLFRYVNEEDRDLLTDEKTAAWFIQRIKKIEADGEAKPFFIATGIFRPHTPLVVPDKYFDMFPVEDILLPNVLADDIEDTPAPRDSRGAKAYAGLIDAYHTPKAALQAYLQAYLASVTFADDRVGEILDALERSRFKDNTTVILFSDHGYHQGQKDELWKYTLWEESTRIPLIIRDPRFATQAGRRVAHPVSLIDIYPTVMDLAGWTGDNVKNDKGLPLSGFSLKPFLENPETQAWAGPDAAISMVASWSSEKPSEQNLSLRTRQYRYTRYPGKGEELYDHNKDPHEWHNLAANPEYAEVRANLSRQMDDQFQVFAAAAATPPTPAKADDEETKAAAWKDKYFSWHPDADTNKDGVLSWPEYQAHKKAAEGSR